ncbi:FAD-dependent oxidoreductase, partial [Bifidobacterium sp. 82T10]
MSNDNANNTIHDAVIVGSGPAGYTAAIYLGRAGYQPLVIAGALTPGGQLVNTTEVENFPGFPDGILGPDLMDAMQKQAEKFGAELVYDDVVSVDFSGDVKTLTLDGGDVIQARAVVITTGSSYRKLGVPGEEEFSGRGVSYCATCDGFFFRGKPIVVVGGGDSAFEEALFLTRFGSS